MRNCEIGNIQLCDFINIEGAAFISIPKSKTRYGVRVVPLHPFVHQRLLQYAAKNGKQDDDYLFRKGSKVQSAVWRQAYRDMGAMLGYNEESLKQENITFYSGRHYWKTLMNAENLGDVEEYFMGHRISADVAKRYNHRDRQGREKIAAKAREVFAILDRRLFTDTGAFQPSPAAPV
jgi:integrase